jgi:hypothetical protein
VFVAMVYFDILIRILVEDLRQEEIDTVKSKLGALEVQYLMILI